MSRARVVALLAVALMGCRSIDIVAEDRPSAALVEVEVMVTSHGRPVPGATVTLWPEEDEWGGFARRMPLTTLTADTIGRAHAITAGFPGGVEVTKPGFVRATLQARRGAPVRLAVELEPDAPIRGRVVDAAGKPLAKASIVVPGAHEWPAIESGPDGSFVIPGLLPGPYEVQARWAPGLDHASSAHVNVVAPADDVLISLARAAMIVLDVSATTRINALRCKYSFYRRASESWVPCNLPRMEPGERPSEIRFGQLDPGVYRILARAENDAMGFSEPIELKVGEAARARVALAPAREMRIQVRRGAGRGIEAWLFVIHDAPAIKTSGEGEAWLQSVPRGEFPIEIRPLDGAPKRVMVPADVDHFDIWLP